MIESQTGNDRGLKRGQGQGRKINLSVLKALRNRRHTLHGLGGTWGQCHKTLLAPASNPSSEAGLGTSIFKPLRTACFSDWINPCHVIPAAHKTEGCLFAPAVIVNELYSRKRKASYYWFPLQDFISSCRLQAHPYGPCYWQMARRSPKARGSAHVHRGLTK